MALHMAYRYFPQMAGCFTLSSFLHNDSMVYEVIFFFLIRCLIEGTVPTKVLSSSNQREEHKNKVCPGRNLFLL